MNNEEIEKIAIKTIEAVSFDPNKVYLLNIKMNSRDIPKEELYKFSQSFLQIFKEKGINIILNPIADEIDVSPAEIIKDKVE